jgi:hypothetical protein
MATAGGVRNESTGELVRRLIDNVQTLIDSQVLMIKQELREDIGQVVGATKTLVIGLVLLVLAGICFFNFLFLAIDRLLPGWGWLAALVVTLLFAIIGGLLANKGKGQVKVQVLARSRETLKEDAAWAKHRLTPNGRSSPSETTSPPRSRSSSAAPGD